MARSVVVLFLLLVCSFGHAQVNEIKSASQSKSLESSFGGSSGGSSFMVEFFFQLFFGNVVQWQSSVLAKRHEVPQTVSVDLLLQTAVQPSSYYIVNPRVRGNWGIFSTDFRANYIIEEKFDGVEYLRTNEWQILQLNFVNTRDFGLRIGAGVLQESFGDRNNYSEWTGAVDIRPYGKKLSGITEYRGSEARQEINGHLRYAWFQRGHLHGYLTAGAVFQRYYQTVNVWGLQGGIAMSLY